MGIAVCFNKILYNSVVEYLPSMLKALGSISQKKTLEIQISYNFHLSKYCLTSQGGARL
jgi:hypothetical protein